MRPSAMGGLLAFKVFIDDEYYAYTTGKRFLYAFLDPGTHKIMTKSENKDEISIVFEEGKTYYFEQKVQLGIMKARNKIERIPEAEGRKKLSKCKLSKVQPAIAATATQK